MRRPRKNYPGEAPRAPAGSLERLTGSAPGEARFGESPIGKRLAHLWRVPVAEFRPADVRFVIAQGFRLEWLVPAALDLLEADPLLFAEYFPGDLRRAVAEIAPDFWAREPGLRARYERVSEIS